MDQLRSAFAGELCGSLKSCAGFSIDVTWEIVDGKQDVEARLVAKGFQEPDLIVGLAESPLLTSPIGADKRAREMELAEFGNSERFCGRGQL